MPNWRSSADRGLTPVVGIVLLVAITLLLAATVAAFTLGLSDTSSTEQMPTVAFSFEYDAATGGHDQLRVVHKSGRAVDVDSIQIVVDGASCAGGADDPNGRYDLSDFGVSGTLKAGESVAIDGSAPVECTSGGDLELRSATVRVTWVTGAGSRSSLLSTWYGPG